jgi:hypothetical protein
LPFIRNVVLAHRTPEICCLLAAGGGASACIEQVGKGFRRQQRHGIVQALQRLTAARAAAPAGAARAEPRQAQNIGKLTPRHCARRRGQGWLGHEPVEDCIGDVEHLVRVAFEMGAKVIH